MSQNALLFIVQSENEMIYPSTKLRTKKKQRLHDKAIPLFNTLIRKSFSLKNSFHTTTECIINLLKHGILEGPGII